MTCQPAYYYRASTNACTPLPIGCTTANSVGACTACSPGFVRSSQGVCSILALGCTAVDTFGVCSTCQPGYFYLASSKTCTPIPFGCTSANSLGVCTGCWDYHSLNSLGGCSFSTTVTCAITHYLSDAKGCSVLPTGCTAANAKDECTGCHTNFALSSKQCVKVIPSNCADVDQTGTLTRHF